jgi:hypothetical protein
MSTTPISGGTVHELPDDLAEALAATPKALEVWESLTPLARNEWICWTISVKQEATRQKHIKQAMENLQSGKRRPCCWIGCIHRTDKEISPSIKGILSKRGKKV